MAVDVRFDAVRSGYPFMSFSFSILPCSFCSFVQILNSSSKKSKLKQIIILNLKVLEMQLERESQIYKPRSNSRPQLYIEGNDKLFFQTIWMFPVFVKCQHSRRCDFCLHCPSASWLPCLKLTFIRPPIW
jgi:hypothetical protein